MNNQTIHGPEQESLDNQANEQKKLIIFIDSGDTLIDESTEIRDENGIVISASTVPEAEKTLRELTEQGFTLALVADGDAQSFQNVHTQNGIYQYFSTLIVSDQIRCCKPNPRMFKAAMGALNLNDGDRSRIIMVGNNLERDIRGANQVGITSVLIDWSPRYPKDPKTEDEKPDYTLHSLPELVGLAQKLEKELSDRGRG